MKNHTDDENKPRPIHKRMKVINHRLYLVSSIEIESPIIRNNIMDDPVLSYIYSNPNSLRNDKIKVKISTIIQNFFILHP